MKLTGQCFCGDLHYEAEIDPAKVGICHCRDCQIFSGSAFRMVGAVPVDSFRITAGEPSYFEKVADSGGIRRMAFCGRCGTHVAALPGKDSGTPFVSVRLSSTDQFDQLRANFELFCDSRVDWLHPVDGAHQVARMPT